MIDLEGLYDSYSSTPSKIIMLVADGLGGVPSPDTRNTELEMAHTPNLDALARQSACGLTIPVAHGVTPGSGPGHLALFGYDPLKYLIGRGVLEALGIGVRLEKGDVAVRGNFCTVDVEGNVTDRRAGRIPTEESMPLCRLLDGIQVPGVKLSVHPVKDHRFVLVLRGDGLVPDVTETDPQRTGVPPLNVVAQSSDAGRCADVLNEFIAQAAEVLRDQPRANMVLLRGISSLPHLPQMGDIYKLRPAAIASYPMYRGIASVLGMTVVPTGPRLADEIQTLEESYQKHDFFFVHFKATDAAGEDGDFPAKMEAIQEFDSVIPRVRALKPDVLVVAGDHSTPALLAMHSWHPVPFLLHSRWTLGDGIESFGERECARGSLGTFPAVNIMLLAMSHAGKFTKFGA